MKAKVINVAVTLLVVDAPAANAAVSNEYVADHDHCVLRYGVDAGGQVGGVVEVGEAAVDEVPA